MEEFDAEIYDIVRQIPPGRVVTYGQLARLDLSKHLWEEIAPIA